MALFLSVHNQLSGLGAFDFSVYMDGSLCDLEGVNMKAGTAVFFKDINLGLEVEVFDMVSSILVELQANVLALECVPNSSSVHLFSDSQAVLDASLHHRLLVAIQKCLYDRHYPSVVCLYYSNIELLDYVFSCAFNVAAQFQLFVDFVSTWRTVSGLFHVFSHVSQMLYNCLADLEFVASLCKGFVFVNWCQEATSCFNNSKVVFDKVVEFVCSLCLSFRNDIWLVHSKHCAYMKKHGLIFCNGLISVSVSSDMLVFLVRIVRLLGIDDAFDVSFGLHSSCQFFSGISNLVSVHVSM
ncbi:hypothetical protein G9A89_008240 [Geosiphon pyriformis]|nr:hypothetical protein G9A89_008240 [Geosiphon pyriformis]